jgi:beta-lactamase regulating signal transducer with metallopeptidase domain/HEAT repeat protein
MTMSVFAVVVQAVAGWLLTYAIHSTILLGLAWLLAERLREQHAWLDWVWKLALVGALVTTTAQSALRVQPLGGRWSPWSSVATSGGQERVAEDASVRRSRGAGVEGTETAQTRSDAGQAGSEPVGDNRGRAATECCSSEASRNETHASGMRDSLGAFSRNVLGFLKVFWPALLAGTWLLVAGIGVVRFARRQRALYRMLGRRQPLVHGYLSRTLDELCAASGVRRPVRLTVTRRCVVPVALLGREIVVPERFVTDLDGEQQRAALAHELAHHIRRDPQWLLLGFLLERIFWFQPLQRRARQELRENAEVMCDDWAAQQTHSHGVARCLEAVAQWVAPAPEWQTTAASWMAFGNSGLVRRMERLRRAERVRPARRSLALSTVLVLPALLVVAPVVSSAGIPATDAFRLRPSAPGEPIPMSAEAQRTAPAQQTQPVRFVAQKGVIRSPQPADPLETRWAWALEEAARRGLSGFWIVFGFSHPASGDERFISDSHFSDQRIGMTGLGTLLGETDASAIAGNVGALFHFTGADDRRIDRIGHRSMSVGFDFADEPVFWLGHAPEAQSLMRLERIFESVAAPKLLEEVVEAYGVHPTTDLVLPFLTRALQPDMHEDVRSEAAESLERHPDPRVVPLLVHVARTDPSVHVREEALEALGDVDEPLAVAALLDLAQSAGDTWMQIEATEALGDQVPDLAFPALRTLIGSSVDARVQLEAVQSLGELRTREAMGTLVRLIWEHESPAVRRKAVDKLEDFVAFGVFEPLDSILTAHDDEAVLDEALEVLASMSDPAADQRIAGAARTSRSPLIRRKALELLGDAQERADDRPASTLSPDTLTALLERAIFEDADPGVRLEALEVAAESLPRAQAEWLLRRVADEHSVGDVRAEALKRLDEV